MKPHVDRTGLLPALPVLAALAGVSALGWAYLAQPQSMVMAGPAGAMAMPAAAMSMPMTPSTAHWTSPHAAEVLAMWSAMALAMMLPTAAPTLIRLAATGEGAARRILGFAAGYLAPWLGLAAAATLLQWSLEQVGVLTGGVVTDLRLGSLILAAVGIFQLLPLKRACLARCAAAARPAGSSSGWNAALAGLRYAAPCLGASGTLMVVPVATGLMNAPWLALLTVWLLLERLAPRGGILAAVGGLCLLAYAAARLWIR